MKALRISGRQVLEDAGTRPVSSLEKKQELGQFLTPEGIADFMASLFETRRSEYALLDAGAGEGALTSAFVRQLCAKHPRPRKISVTAYEVDQAILPSLRQNLRRCGDDCERSGIEFRAEIRHEDFIEAGLAFVRQGFLSSQQTPFDVAILNPPYRKINSDSRDRWLLREAGIETSNLYTGFLALAAELLCEDGELVAICPRSFCNGPYFKPFRRQFLHSMSLRRLHVFESRSAAFQRDAVLQENVIVHAIKSPIKADPVVISVSNGTPGSCIIERRRAYAEVVSPGDPDLFIHLVMGESDQVARQKMARFTATLDHLGVEVSTGRVVDFRARQFIVKEPTQGTVPLIYPCHFNGGFVHWPRLGGRKPNAILDDERTRELFVPGAIYVLVKRFSAKEERRRIVACMYDPHRISAKHVGFENHLNYFHAHGRGLSMDLAKGLTAFLNSTLVDVYFRQFNGHTQVNATDLRSLRYPQRAELESLGQEVGEVFPTQGELDALIERELF